MLLVEKLLGSPTTEPVYVEDVFSTTLYDGTGASQNISTGVRLGAGATSSGWIASILPTNYPSLNVAAVDSSGNVYAVGAEWTGSDRAYLIKYTPSGGFQWQRNLAISAFRSAKIDSSGNIYVTGLVTITGRSNEIVIAKYDSNGTVLWQRTLGTTNADNLPVLDIDSSGNVYVTGTTATTDVVLLAKYNTSGVIQWQRTLSTASSDNVYGIAVDSSGNAYICGSTAAVGSTDMFIAKYNTSGVIQWQRTLGSVSVSDVAYGIGVDSSGNVYISGTGTISGTSNLIVAKYNTNGVLQWQRRTEVTSGFNVDSIAVDSAGNSYALARTAAGSPITSVLVKYNTSGTLQWQRSFSFEGYNLNAGNVVVDASNNIYVGSYFNAIGNFVSSNFYAGLLAKLPNDGSGTGSYQLSTAVGVANCLYTTVSYTEAAASLTDAAGTLTDAAGSATDASSAYAETTGSSSTLVRNLPQDTANGLVWIKGRSGATDHAVYDTVRGATFDLATNTSAGQTTQTTGLTGFFGDGFSIGSLAKLNTYPDIYTSWSFRKQPKFFDVVTYTGTGVARTISHSLASVPGCIMVKRTNVTGDWQVYHTNTTAANYLVLNSTAASTSGATRWNSTAPTSLVFSVGTDATVNANGGTYVAYLFASDAGGFGVNGTDNVITCGGYSGNGSATGPTVTLGYEPQWLLIKNITNAGDWNLIDNMRGFVVGSTDSELNPNLANVESAGTFVTPTATGFQVNTTDSGYNASGNLYIYIAIRRGPMRTPTNGFEVFNPIVYTGTNVDRRLVNTSIAPDMVFVRQRNDTVLGGMVIGDRLRGQPYLLTGSTAAEVSATDAFDIQTVNTVVYGNAFSTMTGFWCGNNAIAKLNTNTASNNHVVEAFKRAPGFFDMVAYTGTSVTSSVAHNLGVPPELMIVKARTTATAAPVYFGNNTQYMFLNSSAAPVTSNAFWGATTPTSTDFTVGSNNAVNQNAVNYMAYLFATVSGVSKVGTYTGTAANQVVSCGFSNVARLVLTKRTNGAGDWYLFDSARGYIFGAADPTLLLNSTAAEVTTSNVISFDLSGFELTAAASATININGATYTYLAIS